MKPLPKKYVHKEAEKKWQQTWNDTGVYHWDKTRSREETFVIDTPPPTVSGLLHMGHIFSYTQADFVARYQRMSGKTVFYPMGFDDNGLPTERLVEKTIKKRATDMSREDFIGECNKVAAGARVEFRRLFESVALSVDWNQVYNTISDDSRKISQLSFLDLFHKERAYRKLQPMLWDPVDQTAIAQAEVEDKELPSHFNDIEFGVEGQSEPIIIGTTRPELIPACVAVFYHPDDERYQHLAGKTAITPLFGVKVPLLPDDEVKIDKGTGLVMCCTFGDETDISWWKKHQLPTRVVLNKFGKIAVTVNDDSIEFQGAEANAALDANNVVDFAKTKEWFEQFLRLKVKIAREKILEVLKEQGLVVKQDEIVHAVKCAERSGAPLEILPTHQWFIKILDQKEELKQRSSQINWYPSYMKVRMDQWIEGLSWDWCISRQRYFGVPFPIWYSKRAGEEGKVLIADADQLPVNPLVDAPKGYSIDEVVPEADVMDTWATSSVSPQLSSKAINNSYSVDFERHKKLFPADLRPQAHEIIRTWAFYTVTKAHLHENSLPWSNMMISGWCLASDKTKMSKSKGNVVTPVDLIEEKGADVVRFWASTSKLGADTAYSEDVLKIGKKLVTKLWNATKFAAIHLDKIEELPHSANDDVERSIICTDIDKWVLSKLHRAIDKATQEFSKYEYSNARAAAEDFFWNDFCDNYLEIAKARAYGESEAVDKKLQMSAVHTIYHCLDGILRLFAPIVPHICEELYSAIFEEKYKQFANGLHSCGTWPDAQMWCNDESAVEAGIATVDILNAVRKAKADHNVSIKWPVELLVVFGDERHIDSISNSLDDLASVTNSLDITCKVSNAPEDVSDVIETELGLFKVMVKLSSQSDVA